MERYTIIAQITNQYLKGSLDRLTIESIDEHNYFLSIIYSDPNNALFDYEIELDFEKSKYHFLSHESKSNLHKFTLNRNIEFEQALTSYLFHTS